MFGYSDDNLLMAPSIYALQKMLRICEKFAQEHNLIFSTDLDPAKSKTKCTAFVQKKTTTLEDIWLCGNKLPWVQQFKHLGNTITNKHPFTDQDVLIKRAQFISKNLELNQEFSFAGSRTKFEVSKVYTSHFYGSPLWDLGSKATLSMESSFNQGVKICFNLPVSTHRNIIEPVTKSMHIRKTHCAALGFCSSNQVFP